MVVGVEQSVKWCANFTDILLTSQNQVSKTNQVLPVLCQILVTPVTSVTTFLKKTYSDRKTGCTYGAQELLGFTRMVVKNGLLQKPVLFVLPVQTGNTWFVLELLFYQNFSKPNNL